VNEISYTRGESRMTLGGKEMESGVTEDDAPIGQAMKWKMDWKKVLVMVNGCQMLEYLQKIVVPTRDKRKDKYTRPIFKCKSKSSLLSYIVAVNNDINNQVNNNRSF
jgi:hypothetical protein